MTLPGSLVFAVRGIRSNLLRSFLTMLGILIGVASVIVLLAVGAGSTAAVKKNLESLGTQTLTVNRSENGNGRAGQVGRFGGGARGFGGGAGGFGGFGGAAPGGGAVPFGAGAGRGGAAAGGSSSNSGTRSQSTALTVADAEALLGTSATPAVAAVAPVVTADSVTASYTGVTETVTAFVGTTPSYVAINNYTVQYGSNLTDSDYTGHRSVAVLGSTMAAELFGRAATAPGKTVTLNGKDFTVAGVLAAKGSSNNSDQDALVIAPLTTVADKFTGVTTSLSSISVKAVSAAALDTAETQIETVLDTRHDVTSATRDFTVVNQTSVVASATASTKTLTVLLGAVAAISLLVGGIGVMNIMLVTVTERTREIGIRKAIGAQRSTIVSQFLVEAVLLSLLGAVAGIVVGYVGSRFTIVGVRPVVELWTVGLSFGVAVAVGLFFGIYPANRAAGLRPIDALRYE